MDVFLRRINLFFPFIRMIQIRVLGRMIGIVSVQMAWKKEEEGNGKRKTNGQCQGPCQSRQEMG